LSDKIIVNRLAGSIGAEIIGADVKNEHHWPIIRKAFIDFSVISIREQNITPDDHLTFAKRWGEINVNRFFNSLESYPNIAIVLKEADQTAAIGEDWHTDHSYDTKPAMCSILHAIDLPPYGGDTCFSSQYAAYDALSNKMKKCWMVNMPGIHLGMHLVTQQKVMRNTKQVTLRTQTKLLKTPCIQ